jgi:radical SAM superfamily enzyme YgiQ (UPF0313 family)
MPDIVLATINARYVHASLGLRYLMANLGELRPRAKILEFVSGARTEDLVERILAETPAVLGLGVYIWNVDESTRLVAQLRRVAPELRIVVGGPEVSHETAEQRICALADHVITGPGDLSFAGLCHQLLDGPRPLTKVIAGTQPELSALELPYDLYSDEDVRQRFLYVEASRGCPFKCEFCLSALDRTAWPFDLDRLLEQLSGLYLRGARRFKFVDRTFNLKTATGLAILGFFLDRLSAAPGDPVFAHFELVPDHLPQALRDAIREFPPGTLQFEIGIQTWNPQVQALISRRQDNERAAQNIAWLVSETQAHLHVDLIAGLPGEDLESFGEGFDRLVSLRPHEIQVGILKRLRGAPIARHTDAFGLRFNPDPPYNVLATDTISFARMQRVARFARYWDLFANSGRFRRTLPLLLGERPFERFMAFSDWIFGRTDATNQLSLERQFELARGWLLEASDAAPAQIDSGLLDDYVACGARGRPAFLDRGLSGAPDRPRAGPRRQARHLA